MFDDAGAKTCTHMHVDNFLCQQAVVREHREPTVFTFESLLTSVIRFSGNAEMQTGPATKVVIFSHVDFLMSFDFDYGCDRRVLFALKLLGVAGPSVVLLWLKHCKFGCLYRCGSEIALARLGID